MTTVAELLRPLVAEIFRGDPPVRFEAWDGSGWGPEGAAMKLSIRSPNALRRLLYSPGELGFARAFVTGDLGFDGDIFDLLRLRDELGGADEHVELSVPRTTRVKLFSAARKLGVIGVPLARPPEEVRPKGRLHSKKRDVVAVTHHYDVSNDFYRLFLGQTMTYSCGYFADSSYSLDQAQQSKNELVCRKLGLRRGMRLLDIGCGWGGLAMHAARQHGATVVGVTVSPNQADLAAKRVAEAGLARAIEIRLQDYREVDDGPYDAIASIGMFEHVGLRQTSRYLSDCFRLLRRGGRLLNHAISRPDPHSAGFDPRSFIARYVFPDGELIEVGRVVSAMHEAGFEVRDVQSLREHYALTLRNWVANLESNWDQAEELAGPARARIWRLYMAGSALGFEANRISVHQTLAVKPDRVGRNSMPLTRGEFVLPQER